MVTKWQNDRELNKQRGIMLTKVQRREKKEEKELSKKNLELQHAIEKWETLVWGHPLRILVEIEVGLRAADEFGYDVNAPVSAAASPVASSMEVRMVAESANQLSASDSSAPVCAPVSAPVPVLSPVTAPVPVSKPQHVVPPEARMVDVNALILEVSERSERTLRKTRIRASERSQRAKRASHNYCTDSSYTSHY